MQPCADWDKSLFWSDEFVFLFLFSKTLKAFQEIDSRVDGVENTADESASQNLTTR